MFQFRTKFRGGKRKFFLRGQCIQKTVNRFLIHKFPVCSNREEQIQVKGILLRLAVDFDTLLQFLTDNFRHLVCKQIELRQVLVGIILLWIIPASLCFLLIRICPVIDCIGRKFIICKCLERRTRQMQRMIPLDLMKCNIGLSCVNALVCLVNDKKLPLHIDQFFQLVVPTTEIQRAF